MLKKSIVVVQILLLAVVTSNAQTKESGIYLDVYLAYNSVGNGFNGETVLISADDIFAVPNINPGIGYGLSVGFRQADLYIELAFQRSEHDFTLVGVKGNAVHSIWSLNLRRLFFENSRLQPFIQLGWIPVMPIRVSDGALLVSQDISSDAIFLGSIGNFNAGGGVEFALRPKISTRFSIVYKRARYVSVESSEENVAIELEEELKADDLNITIGFIFVF